METIILGDVMKDCSLCLCEVCEKRITLDCDNCLMCADTPNQKPIQICPDYPVSHKGHRIDVPVLDDAMENEFIEELKKIFNKNESQD